MTDCMIAVVGGEVRAAVALGHHEQEILDWARDPRVEQIVRVPTPVARQFLFEKWPDLTEAIKSNIECALEAMQEKVAGNA